MKEVIDFLNAHRTGCFATVENGKPRVRPWAFMMEEGGKFWFCTGNTKAVYKQLQENPNMEFTSWEGFTILRLSGVVKFQSDSAMKARILDANPGIKSIYKSADNRVFEVFYLEHGKATLGDKTFEF